MHIWYTRVTSEQRQYNVTNAADFVWVDIVSRKAHVLHCIKVLIQNYKIQHISVNNVPKSDITIAGRRREGGDSSIMLLDVL